MVLLIPVKIIKRKEMSGLQLQWLPFRIAILTLKRTNVLVKIVMIFFAWFLASCK